MIDAVLGMSAIRGPDLGGFCRPSGVVCSGVDGLAPKIKLSFSLYSTVFVKGLLYFTLVLR